ncbi:hypothetical protein CISG_04566 [Coccidioides immitis RMSCC 3703]|uniref:Uncharacterized protein n=1 Tax=Coccidioides immitis RMSCC 3703 TaxID=454286 RepID=A0A0J8QP22_COCIT|nr:hypothetical protein CISG_04566 [Coccidioides immitis RMSCC 3703]
MKENKVKSLLSKEFVLETKWRVPKNPKPAASDELPALPPNADAGKAQGASVADGQGTASSGQSSAPTPPTNYRPSTAEDEKNEQPAPGRAWEKATVAGAPVYPQGPPKPRNPENDKRLADETPARIPQYLELSDLSITGHSMNHPDLEYCNRVWVDPEKYRKHVLCVHMGIRNSTDGNWYPFDRFKKVPNPVCHFDKCEEFEKPTKNLNLVAAHVSGHLPPLINMEDTPLEWGRPFFYSKPLIRWGFFPPPQDENKEPYGIAYKALLVMRNILQNTPRTKPKGRFEGTESWALHCTIPGAQDCSRWLTLTFSFARKSSIRNDIDISWGFISSLVRSRLCFKD